MKRWIRLYWHFIIINFRAFTAYRANSINSLTASLTWGVFSIIVPLLLTSKASMMLGWSRQDILVLSAAQSMLIGFFDFFFGRNLAYFPRYVELGQLDTFLLRPINSQAYLSLQKINFSSLFRFMIGIAFMWTVIAIYSIPVTLASVLIFSISLLIGCILLYGMWFMLIGITIWFSRLSNIVELLYTIRGFTRYPQEVFKEVSFYFFLLFFPLTLVVARPTELLLGRQSVLGIGIVVIFMLMMVYLSRKFWTFALRSYTSASS